MIKTLYTLSIFFMGLGLHLASLFHPKAKLWIRGRKHWRQDLRSATASGGKWIWFHCASLGEFEQGRNLMEEIHQHYPGYKLLITFFSPSGYEIRKDYALAEHVMYLPLDTTRNAEDFLALLKPQVVFFVKYELWINFLQALRSRNIPSLLISARLTEKSSFLKSIFSPLYKKAFHSFAGIFTQDQDTKVLLDNFSQHPAIELSADTRYDRVFRNRERFTPIPEIAAFKGDRICIVAGSTWPKGEELLISAFKKLKDRYPICLILAPHEIHATRIAAWEKQFPKISLRFSEIAQLQSQHRILWINNIGMLSRIYFYADISYVGGAWGTGLHNILEPATFGSPILFGPKYQKFSEALDLIEHGGAFSIDSQESLDQALESLVKERSKRIAIREKNRYFVETQTGATRQILAWVEKMQWLEANPA